MPRGGGNANRSWSWKTALQGVIPPLISPLTDSGDPDEAATSRVVEHVDAATQRRHVEAILKAVPLPVLLYNIPQATHHSLLPVTVSSLAQDARILGIKDSAGDFEAFLRYASLV